MPRRSAAHHRDRVQRIRDPLGKVTGYRVQIRRAGYPAVTKRFDTLEEAKAWRERLAAAIAQRQVDPGALASRVTLAAAVDSYLANELQLLKASSRKDRQYRVEWWRSRLGPVPLRDLTRGMIRAQLDGLTCSGATKNRYQTALSAVLTGAQERDWITRNLAREVKRQRDAKRRERVITAGEWSALLKAARELAAAPGATLLTRQLPQYLEVLYSTGMRAGEALWLQWPDVNLLHGRATLRRTKTDVDRVVPLDPPAIAALRAQEAFRRPQWPWVFVGRSPLAPASRFNTEFGTAKKLAGIGPDANGEPLVIHSLRHSFATELADGGADLFELMAATGHRSIAAAQRYIKTQEQQAFRAVQKRRRPTEPVAADVITIPAKGKRNA